MTSDFLTPLLREAYSEYKANVPSNMTMRIFAKQFIDGHRYGPGATVDEKNSRCKALGMVEMLFTERQDLVVRYFGKPELHDADIKEMMRLVYTETRLDEAGSATVHNPLRCTLCDENWPVIMECVNKNHIFRNDVSEEDIRNLLFCSLREPLVVVDPKGLCYLFEALSTGGFITGQWQTALAESGSVVSNRTKGFITATSLSTVLSRLRQNTAQPFVSDMDLLLEHLKAKNAP